MLRPIQRDRDTEIQRDGATEVRKRLRNRETDGIDATYDFALAGGVGWWFMA